MADETLAEPENPYEHPEAVDGPPPRHWPLFPPVWVWMLFAIFVLLIGFVRVREVSGDRSIVNVLTLILGFLACNVLGLWFVFLSGYSRRCRLTTVGTLIAAIVFFFAAFKIDHVTGELVPVFRPRWQPPRDAQLEQPELVSTTAGIDLQTTTDQDFPQFLGPHRNGVLAGPRLQTDWQSHPPEELWRQPIGAGWSSFAAVNGFAVTIEQRGEEEIVSCYRIRTGELVWAHSETTRHSTVMGGVGPRSTPTIHQGKVYALGATGNLLCLDGSSGAVVWQDNLLARYGVTPEDDLKAVAWGRAGSPLVVDDLLVVPAGGPSKGRKVSLAAFNKETGDLVWEGGDRQVGYSSPMLATLAGKRQIVSVNENNVSAHEPETGEELWQFKWPGKSNAEASVSNAQIVDESRVLLSKHYFTGAAVIGLSAEEQTGVIMTREVWAQPTMLKTKFTNAIVDDQHAYALSDGILECVELANGKRRWKRGRYGQGQILKVGDVLLVQAESGEVALVAAATDKFTELAKFQAIDGQTWNNPCLYGDLLLVRNAEEAACYRLPTHPTPSARPEASAPAANPRE
jgi:outer membrane protein assembly factor BamB